MQKPGKRTAKRKVVMKKASTMGAPYSRKRPGYRASEKKRRNSLLRTPDRDRSVEKKSVPSKKKISGSSKKSQRLVDSSLKKFECLVYYELPVPKHTIAVFERYLIQKRFSEASSGGPLLLKSISRKRENPTTAPPTCRRN